MAEPFRAFSAVFPIITRSAGGDTQILLHRRQNTGYQDGKLDIAASGHVDEGETAVYAVVRECKEELGIDVKPDDLVFAHLQHRISTSVSNMSGRTYYDIYFAVNKFDGTPSIMEPVKCSELIWCDIDDLPDDIIECRKVVIREFRKMNCYSERVET